MFLDINPGKEEGESSLDLCLTRRILDVSLSFLDIALCFGFGVLVDSWLGLSTEIFRVATPLAFEGIIIPDRSGEIALDVIEEAIEDGTSVGEDEVKGVYKNLEYLLNTNQSY